MNCMLDAPFSEKELNEALYSLPRKKCPGEDGLSVFFFQKYWDIIGDRFLDVCNEIFESGSMPTPIAAGLIYMIPKGETQSPDVTKWRPITLLNTIYKILCKSIKYKVASDFAFYHSSIANWPH